MQAKMIRAVLCVLVLACSQLAASADAVCPPSGYSETTLLALKAREFNIRDDAERQAFALALVPCLADTDPTLRDGIAFEALSTFMRAKQL